MYEKTPNYSSCPEDTQYYCDEKPSNDSQYKKGNGVNKTKLKTNQTTLLFQSKTDLTKVFKAKGKSMKIEHEFRFPHFSRVLNLVKG